jgi:hypothetical protein
MKRIVAMMGLVIFLGVVLAGGPLLAQQLAQKGKTNEGPSSKEELFGPKPEIAPVGKCLIGGKYTGVYKDSASETCPNPQTGEFILEINQKGSQIDGTLKNLKTGETFKLQGTVEEGNPSYCQRKVPCCIIKGTLVEVTKGATINVKAPLHMGYPGYGTDNGVYNNPQGCGGMFTMRQQ